MDNEQWKTIRTRPNYEISNTGLVRHVKTKKPLKIYTACNYQYVNNNGVKMYIDSLVASHFLPPFHGHRIIKHLDGNRMNNHVDNLVRVVPERAVRN